MQKKLTLSIKEVLIKFAHDFSKETNQSISHIVEEYLNELKEQETNTNKKKLILKHKNYN